MGSNWVTIQSTIGRVVSKYQMAVVAYAHAHIMFCQKYQVALSRLLTWFNETSINISNFLTFLVIANILHGGLLFLVAILWHLTNHPL